MKIRHLVSLVLAVALAAVAFSPPALAQGKPAAAKSDNIQIPAEYQANLQKQGDAINNAARDAQSAQTVVQAAQSKLEAERLRAQVMFYEITTKLKLDPEKYEFWTENDAKGEPIVVLRRKDVQAKAAPSGPTPAPVPTPSQPAEPPTPKPPGD